MVSTAAFDAASSGSSPGVPVMQSIPFVREPLPCGLDDVPSQGREPCQLGWYDFVVNDLQSHPRMKVAIADVGAGMCAGLRALNSDGHFAVGIENDARLKGIDPMLVITDVSRITDNAFDIVVCMDVIEHVVEDIDFLRHLRRIARSRVYVSTPNFTRSQAANVHHARELTIPQFMRHYRPDALWVGSPDGWHNRTLLLRTFSNHGLPYGENFRVEQGKQRERVIPYANVPDDLSFVDSTVDGQEWPHMMGVWYQKPLS